MTGRRAVLVALAVAALGSALAFLRVGDERERARGSAAAAASLRGVVARLDAALGDAEERLAEAERGLESVRGGGSFTLDPQGGRAWDIRGGASAPDVDQPLAVPIGGPWIPGGSDFVIRKDHLRLIDAGESDWNMEVSGVWKRILAFTEEETDLVDQALGRARERVESYEVENVVEVGSPPDVLAQAGGDLQAFHVPAPPAAGEPWLADLRAELERAVGAERAGILVDKVRVGKRLTESPEAGQTITFAARETGGRTEYKVFLTTDTGTYGVGGGSDGRVPERFAHLLQVVEGE